ncbi:AMP-binding protein [Cupriavidus basilensis]
MKMDFARVMGQVAVQYADQEALVNIERGRRHTFGELHRLTNRIVNMMRTRLGLRRGDVALCILENDNLSLLHAWTAFKGEAAVAHTNIRDAFDEHRSQVEFIRPKVVFLETYLLDRYADMLRERGVSVVCMDLRRRRAKACMTSGNCSKAFRTPIRAYSPTRAPTS